MRNEKGYVNGKHSSPMGIAPIRFGDRESNAPTFPFCSLVWEFEKSDDDTLRSGGVVNEAILVPDRDPGPRAESFGFADVAVGAHVNDGFLISIDTHTPDVQCIRAVSMRIGHRVNECIARRPNRLLK